MGLTSGLMWSIVSYRHTSPGTSATWDTLIEVPMTKTRPTRSLSSTNAQSKSSASFSLKKVMSAVRVYGKGLLLAIPRVGRGGRSTFIIPEGYSARSGSSSLSSLPRPLLLRFFFFTFGLSFESFGPHAFPSSELRASHNGTRTTNMSSSISVPIAFLRH